MFDQLKQFFGLDADRTEQPQELDKNLAAAALLVHVMAVDGQIKPEEEAKLSEVLEQHYSITPDDAKALGKAARRAQNEAIDLYSFTSVLKRDMDDTERRAMIEDLWEMVFSDGTMHEFEDNVVWRVAELLGIQSRERMMLKKRVLDRLEAQG